MSYSNFFSGVGQWQPLCELNQSVTGKFGNHNSALGRNPYGWIYDPYYLDVTFSSADQTDQPNTNVHDNIFSFRIMEALYKLGN
jgi:hypothetical protein